MTRKSTVVKVPIAGIGDFPKASRETLKALRIAFAFEEVTSGTMVLRVEVEGIARRPVVAG
jgi:hypothetical protein